MDPSNKLTKQPAYYEFRIKERLSPQLAAWFEEMSLDVTDTAAQPYTIIHGPVRDQAALYGLIGRIRDLGLTLLSVGPDERKEEEDDN